MFLNKVEKISFFALQRCIQNSRSHHIEILWPKWEAVTPTSTFLDSREDRQLQPRCADVGFEFTDLFQS
jgi:hypothetical protein